MNLYTTNKFKKAVKQFKRNHSKRVLDDIWTAVNKIYKQEVGTSMSNHRLKGKQANGFKDLHLDGGNFILLYRYDVDEDTLILSARINDVVNHKELSEKGTFAEPQWVPTTLDELDDIINGSTNISDLDEGEISDWFYDFYNDEISKILPLDYIKIISITDLVDYVQLICKGTQYHSTCDNTRFRQSCIDISNMCKKYDIRCTMIRSLINNSDEYTVSLKLTIPLEIQEET